MRKQKANILIQEKENRVKNIIFHTQDLCPGTNLEMRKKTAQERRLKWEDY